MNQEQIADKLKKASGKTVYKGELTAYAVKSIELGRSNYPVSNLIAYCQGMGLRMIMTDMATEDRFFPASILEVHKILDLLMNRYEVDAKLVYRKTAAHYTPPKSFEAEEVEKMRSTGKNKYAAPLSIKTFLAVCEVIHCDLSFESN